MVTLKALVLLGTLGCLLTTAPLAPGNGQPEGTPAPGLAGHPAAQMVGLWRGTASRLGRDGQWLTATGVERARWNLAGTAILVEGYGYKEDPDTHERTVGHDAVGLIEHNASDNTAIFYAKRAGGEFERHTLEVDAETGAMRWDMRPPTGGTIRFTITLTEARWHEVGEMSRDGGATWMKILETDLQKAKE